MTGLIFINIRLVKVTSIIRYSYEKYILMMIMFVGVEELLCVSAFRVTSVMHELCTQTSFYCTDVSTCTIMFRLQILYSI